MGKGGTVDGSGGGGALGGEPGGRGGKSSLISLFGTISPFTSFKGSSLFSFFSSTLFVDPNFPVTIEN